jgi:hypothetical protein
MNPIRLPWQILVASVLFAMAAGIARAQDNARIAIENVFDSLDDNNARAAVALLAEAARRHPEDRKIGAMLYTLLRVKRWPIAQTLPVKLPAEVTVLDWSPDGNWVIAGAEDGTVRILDADTGKLFPVTIKHVQAVFGVAILPGNERAFSVGKGGTAKSGESATERLCSSGATSRMCSPPSRYQRMASGSRSVT